MNFCVEIGDVVGDVRNGFFSVFRKIKSEIEGDFFSNYGVEISEI